MQKYLQEFGKFLQKKWSNFGAKKFLKIYRIISELMKNYFLT